MVPHSLVPKVRTAVYTNA